MNPGVDADDAVFERFGDAPDAADVAAVEVRGQAELGVVRQRDRLVFGLEPESGATGPNVSSRATAISASRRSAPSARRTARRARALAADEHVRALSTRIGDVLLDLLDRLLSSISGPCVDAGVEPGADLQLRDRSASFAANAS